MSDEKSGQKSNILIKVGGLIGSVAIVSTGLATIVKDGSTIWEKLPLAKVPGTAEPAPSTLSFPNPQLNQLQNKTKCIRNAITPREIRV